MNDVTELYFLENIVDIQYICTFIQQNQGHKREELSRGQRRETHFSGESCSRCGISLTRRFLSSMCRMPFCVYNVLSCSPMSTNYYKFVINNLKESKEYNRVGEDTLEMYLR